MLGRTHYAAEINETLEGQTVTVAGWVHRRRDHGGLIFIDLRDRSGLVQIVADPTQEENFRELDRVRLEYVLAVQGTVKRRPEGMENKELASGAVEISPERVEILAEAKTPPFMPADADAVDEILRLKYRYIDLRRISLLNNFILRDKVLMAVRQFFHSHGFLDVETPSLARSTPEGARDFLVPSRLQPGAFYALPQSPQIFKQLLMVAGFDRYYQIAKVFRDEDLRADRQPEFTQIDVEMSFMSQEEILNMMEAMLRYVFQESLGVNLEPFPRMTWQEAMEGYGSDKPDLRAGEKLWNLTEMTAQQIAWPVLRESSFVGGVVFRDYQPSRKHLDNWVDFAKSLGAGGLIWIVKSPGQIRSSAGKWLSAEELQMLADTVQLRDGDVLLIVAGDKMPSLNVLGQLRLEFARQENRIEEGWRFLWVTDFPLFEWSQEENRLVSAHHPFTMPHPDDIALIETDPLAVRSQAYDVVLNGTELASGSLRIFQPQLQARIFSALGLKPEEIDEKFGFLIQAFQYGAPPHGGIAFGLDRMVMLMAGAKSLREVIAFPKTARGIDPLMNAPSPVDPRQLDEVGIQIKK
ncbi:aspartate--tRNA ligase [Sulfobacillus thermosulfidooxidans]|uniref:aspartate--tRNA ligase n=1 Tax=Sulfobacillus thermosulfidooxidans TaxID=28034 RepID=UPI00096B93BB|nr:aspartate--tRNA ligase [Sulfobacillus thermosulfidooxidans]OLZ08598.1 aspartate--tRNA ligase [Sulfobacillus thermosulfidooxidans]OLZ13201.1 aspartate--tRNA ligase [Sulfobacillus thermosulfidooxidans]OLZ21581.1 aspartate--tRNA ligase [Sulfobacillus thermosulfidooxidans]